MRIMHELGFIDEFLKLPHTKINRVCMDADGTIRTFGNFGALRLLRFPEPYIALMPQWDFLDFLAAHGGSLRIVMVSADAHQFRRGGDGHDPHDMFLTKPIELDSLLDALSWQLDLTWTVQDGSPRKSPAASRLRRQSPCHRPAGCRCPR